MYRSVLGVVRGAQRNVSDLFLCPLKSLQLRHFEKVYCGSRQQTPSSSLVSDTSRIRLYDLGHIP